MGKFIKKLINESTVKRSLANPHLLLEDTAVGDIDISETLIPHLVNIISTEAAIYNMIEPVPQGPTGVLLMINGVMEQDDIYSSPVLENEYNSTNDDVEMDIKLEKTSLTQYIKPIKTKITIEAIQDIISMLPSESVSDSIAEVLSPEFKRYLVRNLDRFLSDKIKSFGFTENITITNAVDEEGKVFGISSNVYSQVVSYASKLNVSPKDLFIFADRNTCGYLSQANNVIVKEEFINTSGYIGHLNGTPIYLDYTITEDSPTYNDTFVSIGWRHSFEFSPFLISFYMAFSNLSSQPVVFLKNRFGFDQNQIFNSKSVEPVRNIQLAY